MTISKISKDEREELFTLLNSIDHECSSDGEITAKASDGTVVSLGTV